VTTGKEIRAFKGHTEWVYSVAFSPDMRSALSGDGEGAVRLWDLETGDEIIRFDGHTGVVRGVAFSPDSSRAISTGEDRVIRLWSLPR
jgi:WD40 repeat protein